VSKRVLSLLLALTMIMGMITVPVSATEATETDNSGETTVVEPETSTPAVEEEETEAQKQEVQTKSVDRSVHGDHCLCGGSAVGVHGHECADIQWTPMSEALAAIGKSMSAADFGKLPSGYYYLDGDVTSTTVNSPAAGTADNPSQQLVICLNGYDIKAGSSMKYPLFGTRKAFTDLKICDCSGVQDSEGNWSWDGSITGAAISHGITNLNAGATATVYGGNFGGPGGGSYASCFNVCNDSYASYPGYDATAAKKQYDDYGTMLTVYNGYMEGGAVNNSGSVINCWHTVDVNIYGGKFVGGGATKSGGTINIAEGTLVVENATIIGSTAPRGGAITMLDGSITNSTIIGGDATTKGSADYTSSCCCGGAIAIWGKVTIANTTISGGKAQIGGNLYVGGSANVTINAGTVIEDGQAVGTAAGLDARKSSVYGQGGNLFVVSGGVVTMNAGVIRNGTANRTNSTTGAGGNGGNVHLFGKFYLKGGEVYGGKALANPAYRYNTETEAWVSSGATRGLGGNFYIANATGGNLLEMTGGCIYDGEAYGNYGGNIFIGRGDFKLKGGKIWGGKANADNSQQDFTAVTGGTTYSPQGYNYSVNGGSIYIQGFSYNEKAYGARFTMTGGSVGIDANGNAAGGTVSNGGEGGNIYITRNTSVAANAEQIYMKLTGGVIANGTAPGGKGGNISGFGDYTTIGGDVVIRDGSAARGGNITLYNNGTVTIEGGTVTGGKATVEGGNIILDGSNTTAHELKVTGGTISNGTAATRGGDIVIKSGKLLSVSEGATIGGGTVGGKDESICVFAGSMTITGAPALKSICYHEGSTIDATAMTAVAEPIKIIVEALPTVFANVTTDLSSSFVTEVGHIRYAADEATLCVEEHTEVIDEAVDATCKETGLTEGKHCSVCGKVLVEQETVETGDHSYEGVITTEPTLNTEGVKTFTCTVCGDSYTETVAKLEGGEAQIGETKYMTLQEALAVGGEVKLISDVTLTEKVNVTGTVVLNLNGYTLTTYAENGNYGFVVNGDLTIEGEGNVVVNGVYGIGVLGTLTVNGGTFTTSADSDYMIGSWGTTTINGGSFTGVYCVLNNFQGTSTVTGGTFVTAEYDATGEYESCDLFANEGLTVTGGTFSKDVTEYCAEGLAAIQDWDGTYYIGDAPGTEANPIMLTEQENTVEVTGTTWYQGYFSGMILTVTGENFTVTYNGETLTPVDGVVTTAVKSANPRMPVVFAITGEGTYTANFTYPIGNMENPAQLVIGENTASIEAGNTQGYFFTWTAEEMGELTITMPAGDWTYAINNMTTYVYGDTQWSDSDPVVNPATVTVAAGDQLQIMVNSYDPNNMWSNPAAELVITASFQGPVAQVGEQKYMTLAAAVEAAEPGATVTLLSDCSGAGVVVNKDITIDFGGYTYTLTAPVGSTGTASNGLQLLKNNNVTLKNGTLTVAEENKSQFYILVQNYANLTVADMTLDGTNLDKWSTTDGDSYTLSNNSGTVAITGATNITANDEGDLAYAFDVCKYASYEAPVVTVDTTGTITGNIEVSEGLDENLQISNGTYTVDVTAWCVEGMAAIQDWDGTYYIGDAPGTEANPIMLTEQENTVEVTGTTWYQGYFSGMILTVTGENFTVTYNGETLTPVDGVVTTAVKSANPRMPVVFAITGEGTYTANFTYPIGNMENPAQLVIGENTAAIAEGGQGYYYTWTAVEDGTLSITMPETGWMYVINNMTTYIYGDQQWSDSDPVVNPGTVTVAKGDVLEIIVNNYDPATPWTAPAGDLFFTAAFEYAPGTEQNPIMVEWTWNEEQTEATASVTVPAGKTYYFSAYVSGMELTIDGEVYGTLNGSRWMPAIFTITNEGEAEAAYELKIYYPVGTQGNPAQLVLGSNTAVIAEGNNQGYYFTWTATETGALVITMPEGGWMYTVNNMTTYVYGDQQWSDSDPVVNPAVVAVTEGDVIQIIVSTYDPANPWTAPAGELVFTAATSQYVAQVGDKQYVDLQTAIDEADGQTVTLLQNVTLTEKLVVNGTVTLNMDWFEITTAAVEDNYSVVVKGDLTIDGYGTWNVNGVYGIGVTGSLTVENGYFNAAENNDYLIGNWGTTTINGGTYYGVYCVLNNFAGTTVIDGGEFNTQATDFSGEYESCDVFADSGVTIESGMFSKDVSEYCAEGKVCIDTGYGMYTVNYPAGSESNPISFNDLQNTVENTGTMWYQTYSDGMIMTITGESYTLTIGGETIVPENGVYTTTISLTDYQPLLFAITGEGTYTINFTYPLGASENPAQLVMGENTASVAEGSWGYYYTWTATEEGILTITGIEGNQFYVNNLTSYIYGDIVEGAGSYSVNVAAGDQIQVSVNTFDAEQWWNTPAGETCITASFQATGSTEPEGPIVGEGETATPDAPILVEYTAETDGILSVTISGNPGYKVEVFDAEGNTVGLPNTGKAEATYTYELTAGTYTVRMVGYANWDEASATVNYSISFEASQGGEVEKAEYEVDYNTTLVVGDNTVTLLDTAITTIYAFEPTEEGTYTVTAPEGAVVGYWGAGEWFLTDPMSTTNSIEWTCTSVGQSAYIGVSGIEGEFVLTVTKTASGSGHEQVEYTVYENVHTFPEGFNQLTGEETLLNVNITEAHTAVLGTDGYYHLDTADGPVLYVDLQTDAFMMNVAAAPGGANTMRGEYNGVKYDFLTAMGAYADYELYPLTEDLMAFIQGYGKYQGWFMTGMSPFAEINEGTANADTAWMVLCRYVEKEEPVIEKFDIDVARMVLGNALEFQFGVDKSRFTTTEGYYAVIEKTWADGSTTTKTIPAEEWGTVGIYWAIVYDGMAAKEMCDVFYVTIYNADDVAVSTTKTDSVRDYVMRNVDKSSDVLKTLMVNMLNYGAAAQLQFNYATDDLANSLLTDTQKAWASTELAELNSYLVKGTNYMGTRLVLESRIQLQVAFKGMTRDMYAIYTYTDNKGEVKTVRVEGADFVDVGVLGVEMSALVYADARNLVEITVYNADGTVYGTATDSIEGYAARNAKGEDDVVIALMKFADSAKAYLYPEA